MNSFVSIDEQGRCNMMVTNPTGFTQKLEKDTVVGDASEVEWEEVELGSDGVVEGNWGVGRKDAVMLGGRCGIDGGLGVETGGFCGMVGGCGAGGQAEEVMDGGGKPMQNDPDNSIDPSDAIQSDAIPIPSGSIPSNSITSDGLLVRQVWKDASGCWADS